MNSQSLREKLIVAQLNISRWSAKTYDKRATKVIESTYHTNKNIGKFQKEIVNSKELREIDKLVSEMRYLHWENTLPWGDNGDRLLPITNYELYKNGIDSLIEKFDIEVDKFVEKYPQLKEEAKIRLNGLFDVKDYPSNVKPKFGVKINYYPVPVAGDVRLDLNTNELLNIRNNISDNVNSRLEDAINDIWLRMEIALNRIVDRLADPNNIFKKSLINNLQDLLEIAPRLNVFNDENLTATCKKMKELLIDPENLRNDNNLRKLVHDKALGLVEDIKTFCSAGARVIEL